MVQWDARDERDPNRNKWLLPAMLIAFGAVELFLGLRGVVDGTFTLQARDRTKRNVVWEQTLEGGQARLYSAVLAIGGVSWFPLSYLGPLALEAKAKRFSFFALPATQRKILVATLVVWSSCKAFTAIVMFLA